MSFMDRLRAIRKTPTDQWEVRWSTFRTFGLHNSGEDKHVEVFATESEALELSRLLYEAGSVLKQEFWASPTVRRQERV